MDERVQSQFDNAKHIVFLTGAGVSTPSGIPDYRSKQGLYTTHKNAEYYLSHTALVKEPDVFYHYVVDNLYTPEALPNVIHEKQATLTRLNRATIITQNIDGLYRKAGATHLIEFHGSLYRVYCQKCGREVDWRDYLKSPTHVGCGGRLRPDVVLYEEGLNEANVAHAVNAMSQADLVVITGTSMRVYPFAGLLDYRNPQATVIVINQEKLNFTFEPEMIQADAADFYRDLKVSSGDNTWKKDV